MQNPTNTNRNFNSLAIHAKKQFATAFGKLLYEYADTYDKVIILCIGTDRITGDSLGPLTGYKLKPLLASLQTPPVLYGTLEEPVHALNLSSFVQNIYKQFSTPLVIAIDASLGLPKHIGRLTLKAGAFNPGSAVGKKMPAIGDITVTGVVNHCHCCSNYLDYSTLQNTRLNTVMKMAEVIAYGLYQGLHAHYTGIPSAL